MIKNLSEKLKPFHGYQVCPVCGGEVEYAGISSGHIIFPGVSTSQMYICKECGYQGSFIIEVDTPEDVEKTREYLKTHKGDNIAPVDSAVHSFPKEYTWLWKVLLALIVITLAIPIIGLFLRFNIAVVAAILFFIVIVLMIVSVIHRKYLNK